MLRCGANQRIPPPGISGLGTPREGWVLDQGSGVGGYAPMTPD
jgi:hypothetical protein